MLKIGEAIQGLSSLMVQNNLVPFGNKAAEEMIRKAYKKGFHHFLRHGKEFCIHADMDGIELFELVSLGLVKD